MNFLNLIFKHHSILIVQGRAVGPDIALGRPDFRLFASYSKIAHTHQIKCQNLIKHGRLCIIDENLLNK